MWAYDGKEGGMDLEERRDLGVWGGVEEEETALGMHKEKEKERKREENTL